MQQFIPNYGFGYNPMMTPQQRVSQFEQQYPQLAQQTNFVTIPVSNVDEANAFRVDLNGTPTFFYNAGKNEVYLKRTNTRTGFADFITFGKLEQSRSDVKPKTDINTYEKDFKALNDKLDNLYSLLANYSQKDELSSEQVSEQASVQVSKGAKNAK